MSDDFIGRRALVTGAGKGIGRATAVRLAELGAKVFALSRTQSDLDSLKADHPQIEILCVDLADWTKTKEAVQKVTPIHLLVNNARVLKLNLILDTTPEDFDHLFNVNVKSILNVSQVVVKNLLERNEKGTIVKISLITAFRGFGTMSTYCATKRAMDFFTKTVDVEWSKNGIRVNSLNPSVILTKMGKQFADCGKAAADVVARTPLGKFVEVELTVNGIAFLLSRISGMINGHNLSVDGGFLCC